MNQTLNPTKTLIYQGEFLTAYQVPNGLNFVLTDDGRQRLIDTQQESCSLDAFIDLSEDLSGNGVFYIVSAEDVGALTDSLLLAENPVDDDGMVSGIGQVHWYPEYQTKGYPLDDPDGITFVAQ